MPIDSKIVIRISSDRAGRPLLERKAIFKTKNFTQNFPDFTILHTPIVLFRNWRHSDTWHIM